MIIMCQLCGSYLTSEYSDNQSMHSFKGCPFHLGDISRRNGFHQSLQRQSACSLLGQPLA